MGLSANHSSKAWPAVDPVGHSSAGTRARGSRHNAASRKGRTQADLDQVIWWLLGVDSASLSRHLAERTTIGDFFETATLHERASSITGMICGVRVETMDDPVMQRVRYLDKLVDELAKGKAMDKILRK